LVTAPAGEAECDDCFQLRQFEPILRRWFRRRSWSSQVARIPQLRPASARHLFGLGAQVPASGRRQFEGPDHDVLSGREVEHRVALEPDSDGLGHRAGGELGPAPAAALRGDGDLRPLMSPASFSV